MTTKLTDLPDTDPFEEKKDDVPVEKPKATKRKRRSSEEIAELNKIAVEKGFKDYKAMERAEKKQLKENITQHEEHEHQPLEKEVPGETSAEPCKASCLTTGITWNLRGQSFVVAYSDEDTAVLKKVPNEVVR